MAGQIIANVVQVPRKVQRLAWLTSQAPSYGEQLPWYHKPPPPPDPPPHPDQRGNQAQAWAFSPMPAYAETVVWWQKPPRPPDPPPHPDQRGRQLLAWSFSPMPGYAETLAWWHKPPPPPDVPVEVRLTTGASSPPWPAAIAPVYIDLGWSRLVRVPPPVPDVFLAAPRPRVEVWSGGSAPTADRLPWRRRYVYLDPPPPVMPPTPRVIGWVPTLKPNPVPPPSHAGIFKPFVERVPDAPQRLRRHTEKVADILNSLLRNGTIYQTAASEYAIDVTAVPGAGPTGTFYDTFP